MCGLFFAGYMVFQLPGGRLAEILGGKRVMSRLMPKSMRINAGETLRNISLALVALMLTVGLAHKHKDI